jgi:hypothetical protein
MPPQPEPSQSAVELLGHALGRLELAGTCLDEVRHPETALRSPDVLVERVQGCLDEVITTLRTLRVRIADLAAEEGGQR